MVENPCSYDSPGRAQKAPRSFQNTHQGCSCPVHVLKARPPFYRYASRAHWRHRCQQWQENSSDTQMPRSASQPHPGELCDIGNTPPSPPRHRASSLGGWAAGLHESTHAEAVVPRQCPLLLRVCQSPHRNDLIPLILPTALAL